jgi:hypothetical protein
MLSRCGTHAQWGVRFADAGLAQPMYILEGSAADLQADGVNRE